MGKEVASSAPSPFSLAIMVLLLVGSFVLSSFHLSRSQAHAAPPIIPSGGLNTQVSSPINLPSGQTQYDITGGTRPGGGPNLFHSFDNFNVPNNNIANFLNMGSVDLAGHPLAAGLPTSNILGSVTGVDPSIIFGTIQTNGAGGFGNANLFLMNPHGFLFGPNATVNVGGMVAFTTADYLRFQGTNTLFNKVSTPESLSLLSTVPVEAFGFLGSNPAAIVIQGSMLQVAQGQSLSFIGGNQGFMYMNPDTGNMAAVPDGVMMTGGKLSASGGQINLASVASAGEILSSNLQLGANVNGESFTSLGSITISQDAHIDTAAGTGGTITIRGGELTIRDGATIASATSADPPAPPGSVTISGTSVQMTGSDVVINGTNVSVSGSKMTATNLNGSGGTIAITAGSADQPGNVTIAQNALLDASGTSGGNIIIRGGQFAIADSTLSADTGNTPGALTAIDISITGDLTISDTRGLPTITARTVGTGDAGAVQINSANLLATSSFSDPALLPFPLIDTHTTGTGKGGNVTITTTENLQASGPQELGAFFTFVDSGTAGPGDGANVTITAQNVQLNATTISTGDWVARNVLLDTSGVSGSAGNLTITADRFKLTSSINSILSTDAFAAFADTQHAGNITINVRDINMVNGQITSVGITRGGTITINTDTVVTDFTFFETDTVVGQGGDITVNGRVVELTNGSALISSTFGDGNAGDIHVGATDHVNLIGRTGPNPLGIFEPSGLFSNSFGDLGSHGNAGNIAVTTPRLDMIGGRINTVTTSSGDGGTVTLNVTEKISISGEFLSDPNIVPSIFTLGPLAPSGIVTQTIGSESCSGPCGNAGNVSITTGSLIMGSGAQIDAGTSGTRPGGTITVHATDTISLSGTLSNGSPVAISSRAFSTESGSGTGGDISLSAGQSVTISNGAAVSASSSSLGNAGNIHINAGNLFEMTNHSSVTTEADHASGGAIKITTAPSGTVELNNSTISASVHNGTGGGGNVDIDPLYVLMQNSQILARADQGPGGNITINITNGGLFLPDANSVVSAQSGNPALNGTVTIQSPNSPISGQIQPLGKSPLIATSLLNQRCAALAGGEFSSFTMAGRDSLPTEPGNWLTSPLAMGLVGSGDGTMTENGVRAGLDDVPAHGTTILSLRQIAPAGFLTQIFAVDSSASCQS